MLQDERIKLDRIFESIDSQERSIKRKQRDQELGLKSYSPQERGQSELQRIEKSALNYYTRLNDKMIPTRRRL